MIHVRKIEAKLHAHDLYEMQAITFPVDTPVPVEVGQWWGAFDVDEMVAFAGLTNSRRYTNCGYLVRAGVMEKYRGAGLQKRLIRARIIQGRRNGWDWLYSDTTGSPASGNALIACGFRLYEPRIPYSFKTTLYFRKQIT